MTYTRAEDLIADAEQQFARGGLLVKAESDPLDRDAAVELELVTPHGTLVMPASVIAMLGAIRDYPLEARRRVTFEYVLLAGVNDSLDDASRLARLLRGIRCKVNIIPYNPHPEAPYTRPSRAAIDAFQNECKRLGMPTYLRTPRGDDIDAACGQLANRTAGSPIVPLRIRKGPPPPPPVE